MLVATFSPQWLLTCGLLAWAALFATPLTAQQPKTKSGGNTPKAAAKAAADDPKPVVDPLALPPGFVAPREVREEFTTDKELKFYPFSNAKDQSAHLLKYNGLKITGDLKEADKKLVDEMIHWKLAQMTLKENREVVHTLRQRLVLDLVQSAQAKKPEMHVFMLEKVVQHAPELFDYHFVARLNAAILLAELNEQEEDLKTQRPPVPYKAVAPPLLKLLSDKKQLEAVRMWAVKGLVRVASIKEIKGEIKLPIVSALVDELNRSSAAHPWYQMRLAEGVGQLNALYDRNKQPVVSMALESVLMDEKRPRLARCEAAQALGRVPLDKQINVTKIAVEIVRLAQQMTVDYQKQPKLAEWNICFLKLYLAFRPLNESEKSQGFGLLTQVQKGSLSAHKKSVQEAYEQVLPLVQNIIKNSEAGIPAALAKITEWLKNQPKTIGEGPAATNTTPTTAQGVGTGGK